MLKFLSRLEHKIGERAFHFYCDHDAPLAEIKDSLLHLIKMIGNIEDAQKKQAETQAAPPVEQPKDPVKEEI